MTTAVGIAGALLASPDVRPAFGITAGVAGSFVFGLGMPFAFVNDSLRVDVDRSF
ncbi:hypothetical protein [Sandaracinus amylolyticus]|uniref:hypothetical protein n=1 Tax=Sandaracinus amylolyticus TaxID=927083 RepID=UPI0014707F81|nr:hypothetical protein [Sandaracinus amylolyticus]